MESERLHPVAAVLRPAEPRPTEASCVAGLAISIMKATRNVELRVEVGGVSNQVAQMLIDGLDYEPSWPPR